MKNRMNWSSVLLALCVSLAFWSCGNESIDKLKREVETINEDGKHGRFNQYEI